MQARQADADSASLIQPWGYQVGSCGYCKGSHSSQRTPKSRASYYTTTKRLSVDHYQILVDRGWRRSGTTLYKPDLNHACCPHYTIRLPAAEFRPRRDQRQTLHRWNRYVLGDEYIKEAAKCYPLSKEDKARQRNGFDLLSAVHEAEYPNIKRPPEPTYNFTVTLESDTFTEEKFLLFQNYQHHVHHETFAEITRTSFRNFLCNSPLTRTTRPYPNAADQSKPGQRLGSYHVLYRLDGRLIAMSVLDLLPHAVSGVYFIYHSDFEKWSLGRLSAVREIAFAVEEGYGWYYMGYYIEGCPKMRYKGEYWPQYVLDFGQFGGGGSADAEGEGEVGNEKPFGWRRMDEVRGLLKVSRLAAGEDRRPDVEDKTAKDEMDANVADIDASEQNGEAEAKKKIFATAAEAAQAEDEGMSLFALDFPGMMTASEVEASIDLDAIMVLVARGRIVTTDMLVGWDTTSITEHDTIKGVIGELVACVGPDVARAMVVAFIPP